METLSTNDQPQASQPNAPWTSRVVHGAKIMGIFLLLYLCGPAPFFSYARREIHAQGTLWYGRQRWNQSGIGLALAWPLLCYTIVAYFRVVVAWVWSGIFTTLVAWTHLSLIAAFGSTTLFPPTPMNLLFRWMLLWPFTPLVAYLGEKRTPALPTEIVRVITSHDQHEQESSLFEEQAVEEQPLATTQTQRASKVARPPRTRIKPPANPTQPHVPPPTSLWGSIDWRMVPDTHPLKQATLDTGEQRLNAPCDGSSVRAKQAARILPPPLLPTSASDEDADDWDGEESAIIL